MIRTTSLAIACIVALSVTSANARHAPRAAAAPAADSKAASAPVASAAAPQSPIGYPQALILIRSALAAVEQANEAGDYNVLYAVGSKDFQRVNPPTKLAQTFAPLRAYNLNSVLVLNPQFTQAPVISANGMMSMAGYFDNEGYRIDFQLIYEPEDKHWKLFGVSAGVRPTKTP